MRKLNKLLRYIYVPIIFAIIGYGMLYIALKPVFRIAGSVGGIIIKDNAPNFDSSLSIIYNPEAHKAVEVVDNKVSISSVERPKFGSIYANIKCDEISMDENIYWGDSENILNVGIGQYTGSSLPGYGRPMLICGHRTSFGHHVRNTQIGNVYTVTTNYGVFQYEVYDIIILDESEAEKKVTGWLLEDSEKLIYYTCYPFESSYGNPTKRCFVFAKKISGPVVE